MVGGMLGNGNDSTRTLSSMRTPITTSDKILAGLFLFFIALFFWVINAKAQVQIIGTGGNPYQVWIGDSLDAEYQFNDLHKAIQHSVNRGAWHPDSTIYIRRTEEYRVSGFGDYRMLGQLLWETSQTPDSAYSYTWNSDSTAYDTFTYELKKKTWH